MAVPTRPVGGSLIVSLILAVGGLLITIASFYVIIKVAGLVDVLTEKLKEMKF